VTPASNGGDLLDRRRYSGADLHRLPDDLRGITAALVLGGVAERMKFGAVCVFAVLWPLLSYYPMAHMVWWWAGPDAVAAAPTAPIQAGLIWSFGALDFAGGTVVHINAGIAALVGAVILGKRTGYKTEPCRPTR
jgi:Amt family ammonium transporter